MGVPPQMEYRPQQAKQFPPVSGPDIESEDSESKDSEMEQYRPQQTTQGQYTPLSGPSQPQGPDGYPQTTVYPMGQPSPPVYIVRAPSAARTGMPEFQTQNFECRARERKIIQIKDPNYNEDVEQEILNRQPSGSLTGRTGGSTNNSSPDISEQSGSSRTPSLLVEQNVNAQFAAQVATLLAKDIESENSKSGDSESKDSEMEQYRPQQTTQGQYTPLSGPSQPQGPDGYPQTTVYHMGQPSPPVYIVRAPSAAMTGMPEFQTQNFECRARERKIIQIKDPNYNKDVEQEILNRQPSGSLTGSTGGTRNSYCADFLEQFGSTLGRITLQQLEVPWNKWSAERSVETSVENRHEDAAQPLTNATRSAAGSKVAEEVDQQVAKPKSTAEASEGEVRSVTVRDACYVGDIEKYGVIKNPIDTHTAGLY